MLTSFVCPARVKARKEEWNVERERWNRLRKRYTFDSIQFSSMARVPFDAASLSFIPLRRRQCEKFVSFNGCCTYTCIRLRKFHFLLHPFSHFADFHFFGSLLTLLFPCFSHSFAFLRRLFGLHALTIQNKGFVTLPFLMID